MSSNRGGHHFGSWGVAGKAAAAMAAKPVKPAAWQVPQDKNFPLGYPLVD